MPTEPPRERQQSSMSSSKMPSKHGREHQYYSNILEHEPDALDLNTTLEDDVFVPDDWSPSPKEPRCPKYNKRPRNYYGWAEADSSLGYDFMYRLSEGTFMEYLSSKGNVLVMFYESVNGQMTPEVEYLGKQMAEAAKQTRKGNHGYALVDCTKETSLCAEMRHHPVNKEYVTKYPFFNVFVRSYPAISIAETEGLNAEVLKRFVEYDYGKQ